MRYFKLVINYFLLLTIPLWGTVIVVANSRRLRDWTTAENLLERIKELAVCLFAPFALLLFLGIIKLIEVKGFNERLEQQDKIDTNSIQNMFEAFRYGNHWAWQVFPDAYNVEQERRAIVNDCIVSLNKMSIMATGKGIKTREKK